MNETIINAVFLVVFVAPTIGPAIIAALFKIPVSIKLTLVFSSVLTGIYTYVKYQELLDIDSAYPSNLGVLEVAIAEYVFATYITTVLVSFVGFVRSVVLKKSWQTLCSFGLVLTACVVIGEKYELYVMFRRHL
jgi:hypothetical protein